MAIPDVRFRNELTAIRPRKVIDLERNPPERLIGVIDPKLMADSVRIIVQEMVDGGTLSLDADLNLNPHWALDQKFDAPLYPRTS